MLIHQVNPMTEKETLLAVLARNLTDAPHAARYDWLYRHNPAGEAFAYLVMDERTDQAVGVVCVVPHWLWMGMQQVRVGQVGDFGVDVAYRSLGPALLLQQATFKPVTDGALAFVYDCPPDQKGLSPFTRLGVTPFTRLRRYTRLLRADRLLERRLPRRAAGRLARLFTRVLAPSAERAPQGIHIGLHSGEIGEEFTALDRELGGEAGVLRARREAPDLRWRYRADPGRRFQILTARRHGVLRAFLVLRCEGADAYVIDLASASHDRRTVPALLRAAQAVAADTPGVQALHMLAAQDREMVPALRATGFHARALAAWIVPYIPPDSSIAQFFNAHPRWQLRHADTLA